MPERKCNCGRAECFTCHTREIRNRWRSKPANYQSLLERNRKYYRQSRQSDAELEQRMIAKFQREGWDRK